MTDEKKMSHTAYAKKREGPRTFRMLDIGTARIESDGSGPHVVYIDRLPVGGFSGRVYLYPIGVKPPEFESQPQKPGPPATDDEF